jgi:hypothetical protein
VSFRAQLREPAVCLYSPRCQEGFFSATGLLPNLILGNSWAAFVTLTVSGRRAI